VETDYEYFLKKCLSNLQQNAVPISSHGYYINMAIKRRSYNYHPRSGWELHNV